MKKDLTEKLNALKTVKDLKSSIQTKMTDFSEAIEDLQTQKEEKRQQRQTALSFDKEAGSITKAITKIDTEIEEKHDAIIGLKKRLKEIQQDQEALESSIKDIHNAIILEKLKEIGVEYNQKAEELSKIIEKFWLLYDNLSHKRVATGIFCHDLYESAISNIPALKITGKSHFKKSHFFKLYDFRNYRSSEDKQQIYQQLEIPSIKNN
jgi:predicted  nucleic acid-binding Zn-ribbon protein